MKRILKIIFLLFVVIGMFTIFSNITAQADFSYSNELNKKYVQKSADSKDKDGKLTVSGATENVMATILRVMRIVAMGVAVVMLTYVAIKYMSAAPEQKAEFKKSAAAYIVGALVLFGTSGILTIIQSFAVTATGT